jgi:hypothetical protein
MQSMLEVEEYADLVDDLNHTVLCVCVCVHVCACVCVCVCVFLFTFVRVH